MPKVGQEKEPSSTQGQGEAQGDNPHNKKEQGTHCVFLVQPKWTLSKIMSKGEEKNQSQRRKHKSRGSFQDKNQGII